MSNLADKYKIGLFVVIGMFLIVVSFISLGILKYFEPKHTFMTVVKESVQGLERGAKVKYKGVTFGKVNEIVISPIDENIWIYMDFSKGKSEVSKKVGTEWQREFKANIDKAIKRGLRCQLRYEGITGNLYVEISLFDNVKYPVDSSISLPEDHPTYIPSAPPILMVSIMEQVQTSLEKISKIDFPEISVEVKQMLANSNKILQGDEIKTIISEVKSVSGNLEKLSNTLHETITKKRIETVMSTLDTTMKAVQDTSLQMSSLLIQTKKELEIANVKDTIASAKRLMDTSGTVIKTLDGLRVEVYRSLSVLTETLRSAQNLMDYMEKNPQAVIRGKLDKPVVAP